MWFGPLRGSKGEDLYGLLRLGLHNAMQKSLRHSQVLETFRNDLVTSNDHTKPTLLDVDMSHHYIVSLILRL